MYYPLDEYIFVYSLYESSYMVQNLVESLLYIALINPNLV